MGRDCLLQTARQAGLKANSSIASDTRDERNHKTDHIHVEKLLDGTGYARENIVRVRTNQSQSSDDDHKNHGQHYSIFRDVLARVFSP